MGLSASSSQESTFSFGLPLLEKAKNVQLLVGYLEREK